MKKVIRDGNRVRVQTVNNQPSKTHQHFKDQCDINKIIAKYKTTGEFNHLTNRQGRYADVSQITDYQESMQKVLNANAAFASLPSQIRARFQNDPAQLLAFLQDEKNYDEGVKLGLFNPKETPPQTNISPKENDSNENKKANKQKKETQLALEPDQK